MRAVDHIEILRITTLIKGVTNMIKGSANFKEI